MKNIILLFCLFNCFFTHIIAQQQNEKKLLSGCSAKNYNTDSLKVEIDDLSKYREAYNYIILDSINQGKDIFVSDVIVDMDRFYFKDYVKNDSSLTHTINSLTKYYWFDDFSSPEIKKLFGEQNKNAKSILFFSLVEKNTLRADLFVKRHNINDFKYNWIINSNRDKVYAYLFTFDEVSKIKYAFRIEIIYGI